mgnify:CR=1 FL=1|jgi:hypothetical protein
MIQTVGLLVATIWVLMEVIHHYKGEITIVPIKGIMLGALYNSDEIKDEDTEHIIQILFFVFSFNFIWITEN